MKRQNIKLKYFHRCQIGRAQRYMRKNSSENISLVKIAKEAGASEFHFGHIFMSYTGETTFSYLRRMRLLNALRIFQEDAVCSVTEVALNVGYETPSAFNKVFKAKFKISPSEFHKLRQAEQEKLIYDFSSTQFDKEIIMNLTSKPKIVIRPTIHLLYIEKSGIFQEVAMPTWYELIPIIDQKVDKTKITEYLGFSIMDSKTKDESTMYYSAGVSIFEKPDVIPKGLQYKKVAGGQYAKFVLTGPTSGVWTAFEKIFRQLAESQIQLRDGACIENYLNNPELTPENELVTELLVPIKS